MRVLKLLRGVAAVGVVAAAFRDSARGRWLRPSVPFAGDDEEGGMAVDEQEPVLGYDGMDRDTLLEWLRDAELDRATFRVIGNEQLLEIARQRIYQNPGKYVSHVYGEHEAGGQVREPLHDLGGGTGRCEGADPERIVGIRKAGL